MKPLDPQEFFDSLYDEDSPAWPVISVDLNGVLDIYSGWAGKVEEFPAHPQAAEFLQALREVFHTIVVFTATQPVEYAMAWLEKNGLAQYVDYCTNWKVPSFVYLDDRAVCFRGNYQETLEEIRRFVPHWSV